MAKCNEMPSFRTLRDPEPKRVSFSSYSLYQTEELPPDLANSCSLPDGMNVVIKLWLTLTFNLRGARHPALYLLQLTKSS